MLQESSPARNGKEKANKMSNPIQVIDFICCRII
jgi:hypothetical protein